MQRFAIILSGLVLWSACVSTVRPPGAPPSGKKIVVDSVTFEGLKKVSRKELLSGLALRPPERSMIIKSVETVFDKMSLRLDVQGIENYLHRNGFFAAKVTRIKTTPKGRDRIRIHYTIDEGAPTLIKAIYLTQAGATNFSDDELIKLAGLQRGRKLVYDEYEEAKNRILLHLAHRGHAFARVLGKVAVNQNSNDAVITFRVEPGQLVRFGDLRISGNKRIPKEPIKARVTFLPGDPFSDAALNRTKDRLYKTGLFSSARFEYDRSAKGELADIHLKVSEGKRNEVRAGAGFGIDSAGYEAHGRGYISRKSFLTPLGTGSLELEPRCRYFDGVEGWCKPGIEAKSSYVLEDFLATNLRLSNALSYVVQPLPAYSSIGPHASSTLSYPLIADRLTASLGWHFQWLTITSKAEGLTDANQATLGLDESYRVGSLKGRLTYDQRDNILSPKRGFFAQIELIQSNALLGSAFRFTRILPEASLYLPIHKRLTFATKLRYGHTFGSGVLPISERFYAGGAASHRGFGARRLSPMYGDPKLVPVGGKSLLEGSAELRLSPLFVDWLGVVGFLDAGDVTLEPSDLDPGNLHVAAGAGLRLITPIGPVRGDVGFRLNRMTADDPDPNCPWAWFLSLGEAF
jgi:outer membrane protein assembly complex protein YaeT